MPKRYIWLLLLICSVFFLFTSCNKQEEENNIDVQIEVLELEMVLGEQKEIAYSTNKREDIKIEAESDVISLDVNNDLIIVRANEIGNSKINISYDNEIIKSIAVKVKENPIYIPVPTGKLILKGIDKEASVKVIITDPNLLNEEIHWQLEKENIVSIETQGAIAHFVSLQRGNTKVTIQIGAYSNTFTLYVSNIRGDIE